MNCPNCGSKSGVDTKGRDFCHACKKDFPNKNKHITPIITRNKLSLPDLVRPIPKEAYSYLFKYFGLDTNTLDVYWSEKYERLCFPYFTLNNGFNVKLEGCWMRCIKTITEHEMGTWGNHSCPKWLYAGEDKNNIVWLYEQQDNKFVNRHLKSVVIVEDVLSALKVSKFRDCICLGGTTISDKVLTKCLEYAKMYLFLDGDTAGKTAKTKIRNKLKGLREVVVIRNKLDPKEYTDVELQEYLK